MPSNASLLAAQEEEEAPPPGQEEEEEMFARLSPSLIPNSLDAGTAVVVSNIRVDADSAQISEPS